MCNCSTSKYSSVPEALISSMMGILISLAVSPDLNKITPSPPSKSFPWKADLSIVLYLTCKNIVTKKMYLQFFHISICCKNIIFKNMKYYFLKHRKRKVFLLEALKYLCLPQ